MTLPPYCYWNTLVVCAGCERRAQVYAECCGQAFCSAECEAAHVQAKHEEPA